MGSTPVRVAMIGFDHWYTALPLARAFAEHPEIEVVGIADADRNRAMDVLARTGLNAPIATEKELLEDPRVQAIAAFGSCEKNPAVCVTAAENGKHIVSIKPMARTLDEATQILTAVRRAGVRFLPGESRPRASAFAQQVRRWLDEGRFGRILTANFQTLSGLPRAWPDADDPGWWVDPERAPGGGWIDHSIYHIDLLRWLTGARVTKVFGVSGNLRHSLGVEDYGHATIEFDSGLVATVEDTWTAPAGGSRQTTTLQGSDGALYHDTLTGKLAITDPDYGGWVQVAAPPSHPSSVDDVIATVRGEGEPLASVEDAWENLAICEAFYRSCAVGKPVKPARLPA